MAISWYPGHMYKANKDMAKVIEGIDLIIEILDARLPLASSNPMLKKLRGERPCVRILNKADLAEPDVTGQWISYFNQQPQSRAMTNGKDRPLNTRELLRVCQQLADASPLRRGGARKYSAMIVGIPNVGKSTLMNQILARKVARTGNEPAVTKARQRVRLDDRWYLSDTPGVLWPKLEDQTAAYRLAATGAIRNTAIEFEDVALFTAEMLLRDFPHLLRERYGLTELPDRPETFLELLAGARGCLRKNGQPDWHSRLASSARDVALWLLHGPEAEGKAIEEWERLGARPILCPSGGSGLDMRAAMQALGSAGLTRVFCEGGGELAASLLRVGLVDRLASFTAGLALGADGRAGVGALALDDLDAAPRFELEELRPIGGDALSLWRRV